MVFVDRSVGIDQHHLVVFALGGVTGTASMPRRMPHLHELAVDGVWTPQMRTVHSTTHSKLGWISVFFAASSVQYGCDDNGCDGVPRVSDSLRSWVDILEEDHDYTVTVLSEHGKLMSDVLGRRVDHFKRGTLKLFDKATSIVPNGQKQLTIIHLVDADRQGHVRGFQSTNYFASILCIDEQIYRIAHHFWSYRPNSTTFMLVADHGGERYGHDKFTLNTVQVPFALWGHFVPRRTHIAGRGTETLQIAPTLLTIMGISDSIPSIWLERPLMNYSSNTSIYGRQPNIPTPSPLDRQACAIPQSVVHEDLKKNIRGLQTILWSTLLLIGVSTYCCWHGVSIY